MMRPCRAGSGSGRPLRRSVWNKGYATEGSRALISMGFTSPGVRRVFAHTMMVNTASRCVMEKCGLTLVRTTPYEGTGPIEGAEQGVALCDLGRWQPCRNGNRKKAYSFHDPVHAIERPYSI
jgi:hypothetical protein